MSYKNVPVAGRKRKKRLPGKTARRSASSTSARRATARPKKKKAKRGSTRSAAKKAPRKYTRYDPVTFESARVTTADVRYDEWLTAAQMRTEKRRVKKEREQTIKTAERIAREVVPAAAPAVSAGVARARTAARSASAAISRVAGTRVAVGVGAATVGIGTAAAAAIITGLASYYATTWLMSKLPRRPTAEDVRFNAALAHGKARRDAASRLGRPLTPDEQREFNDQWRVKLAAIENRYR